MAIQNDNASTFRIVAIVTAVLLLAAAAFVYLQSGSGSAASGSAADWRQLDTQSSAILAKRVGIESVNTAAAAIASGAQAALEGSELLLDRSGATTIIQEFQQRAARIRETAASLPDGGSGAAGAIAADVAFLRDVRAAAGRARIRVLFGNRDMVALGAEPGRDTVPPPYLSRYAPIFNVIHPFIINTFPICWKDPCSSILLATAT